MAQLTQDLLLSIGQGNEEDPLVQIRQRELDIREQEMALDQAQFTEKQEQRDQEKPLESESKNKGLMFKNKLRMIS